VFPSSRTRSTLNRHPPTHVVRRAPHYPRMSALGHKQTFRNAIVMSALPPKADISQCNRHVRFTPESRHLQRNSRCPLRAKSGLMQRSKKDRYSITSSARAGPTSSSAPTAQPYRDSARPRLRPSGAARRRSGTYYWRETPCYPGDNYPCCVGRFSGVCFFHAGGAVNRR
jgi:hypothetical protein